MLKPNEKGSSICFPDSEGDDSFNLVKKMVMIWCPTCGKNGGMKTIKEVEDIKINVELERFYNIYFFRVIVDIIILL